jgi:putative transposase
VFIKDNRKDHEVRTLCRILKVSASGYYEWLSRPVSNRVESNERLLTQINHIHKESREAYGSLKTWKALNAQGVACGKHRVARLRRINGIETRRVKRFKITTNSKNTKWIAPNLLNRCFKTQRPNQVWVGDVTFIATRMGWLYLAVMIDLYSRKIIGWSMSNRIDKQLVLDALDMALIRRKPNSEVLHHTDRGAIYASDEYREKLSAHQLLRSMSRKADCYDNAVAESFFSTLKNELVLGNVFESRDRARTDIFDYIEIFYNRQRIHQTLNYITPEKMEMMTVA